MLLKNYYVNLNLVIQYHSMVKTKLEQHQLRPSVIASGFFSNSLEKLLFKIRDNGRGFGPTDVFCAKA